MLNQPKFRPRKRRRFQPPAQAPGRVGRLKDMRADVTSMIESAATGCAARHPPTLSAAARAHGITPRTLAVLACAAATPGASATEIHKRLNLQKCAVSYAVSNLKRRGLVRIQVDPADQRRFNLFPTSSGLALLRSVSASVRRPPVADAPAHSDAPRAAEDRLLAA